MKILRSPFVTLILGLLVSSATGLEWFWTHASLLIEQTRARHVAAAEAARPEKPWDFWTPELEGLANELKASRADVAQREATVEQREARVAAERQELDQVRRQVEALRSEISARIIEVQSQEVTNLKTLSDTYSKLTPKAAVAILMQTEDTAFVAKLLSMMKSETSAAILEELSRTPGENNLNLKRAAELTLHLRLLVPAKPAG